MLKHGHQAVKEKRLLYKLSKAGEEAEELVYKSVMGNIIYSAIPKKYKQELVDFDKGSVVDHIGEIVHSIVPFEEFDQAVKESKQFHLVYIRGYIHGGLSYYNDLISEASDEHEVENAPKKTDDILGDIEYGDITERISEKIKKEIEKDNRKLEEEEEERKEMAEELEPEDELDADFDDEVAEDEEVESDEEKEVEVEESQEPQDEESEEKAEEDTEPEDSEEEEDEMVQESTFDKITSADPFKNNINPDEDYISLIKERIVKNYADSEIDDPEQAKLDTIVYISTAVALHELNILSKSQFLRRMED